MIKRGGRRRGKCWAGPAQSKRGAKADARPALGFVSLQSPFSPYPRPAGERARKQDSQATDLILTDFFWNSDNLFVDENFFGFDLFIYVLLFAAFLRLGQVHTICKNAEVQAHCLQKFYNTWEGALRYCWETCFQTSFWELYNNPQQSWQINSSKVRGGARGKSKAGKLLWDLTLMHSTTISTLVSKC